MDSKTLREKFLKFFERNGHKIIPSASLVPSEEEQLAGKEKVLFTSAGMQPLIPYLIGQKEPPSKRLVDVQKCLRTDDIEEVGDGVHHTFFEMLGNWSIGDYWKEEAIRLSFEFLTEELAIPVKKLAVTVFAGDEDASKDEESAEVWKSLGIPEEKIFYFGKSHNWWPTARGEQDSGEYKNPLGPCGPDTEMFYWAGEGEPEGKPNEDSRWVEIWNDVFMQFNRKEDGTLEELPQKNVDTGMGLERTLAILNGKKSDYETDLFDSIIKCIEKVYGNLYKENTKSMRIIADYLRAATFIVSEGIEPSNKEQGYVLRRLIRRAYDNIVGQYSPDSKTTTTTSGQNWMIFENVIRQAIEIYSGDSRYKYLQEKQDYILSVIKKEVDSYVSLTTTTTTTTLPQEKQISGKRAFDLYATHGFSPLKLRALGYEFNQDEYDEEFKKHQEISNPTPKGVFKGGLADHSEVVTKYHTATHLLHQALRDVLGPEVFQKGSNITAERLRFDFSFDRKMTDGEIKQVEDLVNKKIEEDLKVDRKIVSPEEAKKLNAIGLFDEKYGSEVSIYGVGPGYRLDPGARDQRSRGGYYSLEFCGGPHVERTEVIGKIRITKEEAISAGIRRIRAEIVLR